MLLQLDLRRRIDWVLGKVQLVIAGILMSFGGALKAVPEQWGVLEHVVRWMQQNTWWVVVVGPAVVATIQAIRRRAGNQWAWAAIQRLLDEFRHDVFGHLDDPVDHHRVTLFKYCPWDLCHRNCEWKHWLVAVARSGHLTRSGIRKFRAPDDGERCEGVAGLAWRLRDWVFVPGDSELKIPTSQDDGDAIRTYAARTKVSEAWVRKQLEKNKPLAGSYGALVVLLNGKPWGVLVLDSRAPGTITREKVARFKPIGTLLTPLLERV